MLRTAFEQKTLPKDYSICYLKLLLLKGNTATVEQLIVQQAKQFYHRQALQFLQQGDYSKAKKNNNQAIALHQNSADFHALAGQLWALEGEFSLAAVSWQKALALYPQQPLASSCLQILTEKITSERYR